MTITWKDANDDTHENDGYEIWFEDFDISITTRIYNDVAEGQWYVDSVASMLMKYYSK